jgi:uncharacterized protein (TIGR00288 family)
VLERLVEKGKIVAKKAYADWSRFGTYAGSLHEAAIELIEIPKRSMTGKNSADIRLVVDAIDLAYSKDHIDTFVIVSGDSDFSPLVSKLKELGKHVIGLGLVEATSNLLRDNCDEFIYYEDLDRPDVLPIHGGVQVPEVKRKVFNLLVDSLVALRRENKDVIFSSMVKDTMKRKKPSFNEEYHGYRTFSELLEDGQRHGLIEIEKHKTSGTYVVNRFGDELRRNGQTVVQQLPQPVPLALPLPKPLLQPAPLERSNAPTQRNDRGPRPATPPPLPSQRPLEVRAPLPPARPVQQPVLQQRAPLPPPIAPARVRDNDDDDRLPLGRSLIEDVDDDLDEIPSYSPKRSVPATSAPATAKAAPAKREPVKREPAKPKVAVAEKPVAKATPKPRQTTVEQPVEKPKPIAAPKLIENPKPASKPVVEEDGFGSGLDD